MKQYKHLQILLVMWVFGLLTVNAQAQSCLPNDRLPNNFVAFSHFYSSTSTNSASDRLVVGKMPAGQLSLVPFPTEPNQKFCSPVEIVAGMFADAYVPTPRERSGDFSSFGVPLIDPATNPPMPFPGNRIPSSRLGDPYAWRISGSLFPRGFSQTTPVLPDSIRQGLYIFNNTRLGSWVDPPAVFGFKYSITSASLFTRIVNFPTGFNGLFTVSVGDTLIGTFGPGQSVIFPNGGVAEFTVTGINPLVEIDDPVGFPLRLAFNTTFANFTMQALISFEADVAPRPNGNGNGAITIADWVQIGRFAIRLDTPEIGSEYQRADCAPRATLGDGIINIADWVQAGRYAAGLDPVVAAGSFTAPLGPQLVQPLRATPELAGNTRNLRIADTYFQRGHLGSAQIELDAAGNENAISFSLNFDPKQLSFVDAAVSSGANGAALQVNQSQAANGRVGFALALPTGQQLAAGTRALLKLRFIPNGGDGEVVTNINFSDQLLAREIVDANATPIPQVSYAGGTVTIRGRAAAHVSAASYVGAELAADSIASAFGTKLATMTVAAATTPLPNSLGGTSIKIKDSQGIERMAALFFVSPNQINYQIPAATAEGVATVTIINGAGEVTLGLLSIGKVAPGLFTADASGQGWAAADVVYVKSDQSQVIERVTRFDVGQNKIVPVPIDLNVLGEQVYLTLYGTGLRHHSSLTNVKVKIGGSEVLVNFAGAQGQYAGLDQINLKLPRTLQGQGEVSLAVFADGMAANPVRIMLR